MVSPYKLECPVCEYKNEVPWGVENKTRITCENCSAQLQIKYSKGKPVLRCAFCANIEVGCKEEDCEKGRYHHKRDLLMGDSNG